MKYNNYVIIRTAVMMTSALQAATLRDNDVDDDDLQDGAYSGHLSLELRPLRTARERSIYSDGQKVYL